MILSMGGQLGTAKNRALPRRGEDEKGIFLDLPLTQEKPFNLFYQKTMFMANS